jgi:hypothetical protein
MANYGFYVANTGSTLYSGFTFLDSQSNNITINIPAGKTFYVTASDVITGTSYTNLVVTLVGTLDITYDFSACCSVDSFSVVFPNSLSGYSGSSYYVFYGAFTNSTRVGYGCHNVTAGGPTYPYVTALSFDDVTPYTGCTDCINTYQCDIDECCLLLSVEYSGGYYYRALYNEGIINGRQFYTFPNITGGTIVMYWSDSDWNMDNISTSVARGAGTLTSNYCPSFTSTTIDNSLNGLSDLTGLTINLSSEVISCSGCSPIYCVNNTGLGYDDTFVSGGTYNGDTYFSGVSTDNVIYFTTGGTWCLSTTLGGSCLLEGPYPCTSTCPDLCDDYVFSGNCPTPTPTPTVNCSVLDFTAIFDCEVTPTPSVTPTISVTPTRTPTPTPSNPCGGRAVNVTISGYTPTPTATQTPTPTETPQITRPCSISGNVIYNTIEGDIICPMSKQFQDCFNGQMYYTTSPVPLPSGGTLTKFAIYKADINGVSKCVSFIGINLSVIGTDIIDVTNGPLGFSNLNECYLCTPNVTVTPTISLTPSITPTRTPTPTPSVAPGYYVYQKCGTNKYIIQTLPGPTTTQNQVFKDPEAIEFNECWQFLYYSVTYPEIEPSSIYSNFKGNYFPEYGFDYYDSCDNCFGIFSTVSEI